jgi:hypothetical protein
MSFDIGLRNVKLGQNVADAEEKKKRRETAEHGQNIPTGCDSVTSHPSPLLSPRLGKGPEEQGKSAQQSGPCQPPKGRKL